MDYDKFRRNALAAGERPEDTENTVKLFQDIEKALDGDPYLAPELGSQDDVKVVRLARVFIDRIAAETVNANEVTARWLRANGINNFAADVERGDHWKWWHTEGKKQS